MTFKAHPLFDESPARDWFDVSDDAAPLMAEMEPYAALIGVCRAQRARLEQKVLDRVRAHAGEDAARPYAERGEVLFAPLGDHGFQFYVEFALRDDVSGASADSDFWWGIVFCPGVFDERFGPVDARRWNVVHFGWAVQ